MTSFLDVLKHTTITSQPLSEAAKEVDPPTPFGKPAYVEWSELVQRSQDVAENLCCDEQLSSFVKSTLPKGKVAQESTAHHADLVDYADPEVDIYDAFHDFTTQKSTKTVKISQSFYQQDNTHTAWGRRRS